jgi:phage terminase small subunit
MALNPRQQRFVDEYLIDLNATQAAIRAGYSQKTAHSMGPRLLENVEVQNAIADAEARRSKRTEITADNVLRRLWSVATADPNDLIEYRRVCCPKCYEGDVIDPRRLPDENCSTCFGEGVGIPFPKDTRRVVGDARLLYAGLKITKDGLEIKMHDQQAALLAVAKHLGMMVEKKEVSGPDGKPLQHEHSGTIEIKRTVAERLAKLSDALEQAAENAIETDADREAEGDTQGESVGPSEGNSSDNDS